MRMSADPVTAYRAVFQRWQRGEATRDELEQASRTYLEATDVEPPGLSDESRRLAESLARHGPQYKHRRRRTP